MRLLELRSRIGDLVQGMHKLSVVVQRVVNRRRNLAYLCVEKSSLRGDEVSDTKTRGRHECTLLEWQDTINLVNMASFFWPPNPS
jgi:hypothetical protein